ncbi:purine-nucleoside phosphorylase [Ethanoligenens harbinense]|uniref:Purine nucleoside phosphorylase n=1 Tax=Ethanoligenens harbinense (strain DSM 18485 / JCM 12961 / CGMCC 1.5033 / YUAN-3) TaxID=663278 RepID=E6U7Z9_ETHHY|nr:purine-nucleoside phosphorylase [Ethanoligenens harbinense]ADU25931.1 inosine guanosine and xanthosine phosphorylase family [Ethanoligenens harbinense YUAN-3]AVQ95084.1 purine-nucleoside phosphorylase [Ethanoligenens harbinense YUAN-3]AYF37775.1 purine-nucleoside phosphorylase [Ethanoligenens harbinense]AYF40497.1 purine-nucleoside phosphorylase [Ethanoligenens harbinense]QCN91330.1 purine-nucleoside phosphorylase [Ethanoligenens harbinense]
MGHAEHARRAAETIRDASPLRPQTAVVLGSGLGGFVSAVRDAVELPYADIPHFPCATAPSHAGRLLIGTLAGRPAYVFSGRFHYYEGLSFKRAAFYVRVLHALGVRDLLLTNAAGLINLDFAPGDLMLVRDHINFSGQSPCRGRNLDTLGERFFDMSDAYSGELRALAHAAAEETGVPLREGVYAYMTGPQYETPAEIRALGILGADAVGMSTVPEVIEAAHCGLRTLCISCLTNYGAGLSPDPLRGDEVNENAAARAGDLSALLLAILARL